MSQNPGIPIPIGTIGMDQRQRETLRLLFSRKCENRYHLVEESSAKIFMLDLDSYGGEERWREFRQSHPDQPLILISLKAVSIHDPDAVCVRKPIPVQSLIDAIEQQALRLVDESELPHRSTAPATASTPDIAAQPSVKPAHSKPAARKAASIMDASLEQTFIGTAPDIDPADPDLESKIHYNPEHYLQGHLQHALNMAVRYKQNVAIEGPWPTMELMIEQHQIRIAGEERRLRSHCTLPDTTLKVSLRKFDGAGDTSEDALTYALPTLFWKVALWASRGRLPEGTSLTQPIFLRRWPNFTRLEVTPYAFAIAALWAEQPRSLLDTARHLQIPQRYVFAFYSAARSLQLAGETRRAADTLIQPQEITASKQRGLLGRLLDRLRGGPAS
ncbi:MAG: hypothetical protein ABW080_06150 [Candidatus Thiodiazotropha sp.]